MEKWTTVTSWRPEGGRRNDVEWPSLVAKAEESWGDIQRSLCWVESAASRTLQLSIGAIGGLHYLAETFIVEVLCFASLRISPGFHFIFVSCCSRGKANKPVSWQDKIWGMLLMAWLGIAPLIAVVFLFNVYDSGPPDWSMGIGVAPLVRPVIFAWYIFLVYTLVTAPLIYFSFSPSSPVLLNQLNLLSIEISTESIQYGSL